MKFITNFLKFTRELKGRINYIRNIMQLIKTIASTRRNGFHQKECTVKKNDFH